MKVAKKVGAALKNKFRSYEVQKFLEKVSS